ncbi:MAG: hypothetical protein JWP36_1283 [Paucimonas sp.]|jgi:hemerythrin|nr:hypothetical protein [Paucimonas sp.]
MLYEIWSPGFTTGLRWLDDHHCRLAQALQEANEASDRDFCKAYRALIGKLETAFREEEERLDDVNPALVKSHREQHGRVLRGLHCAHSRILDGDIELGREIISDLLPKWLGLHIASMDIPLANAMSERRPPDRAPETRVRERYS